MHHGKHVRTLSRTSAHRNAMLRNMATSLIRHERIETTLAKAKELKRIADKMITLGKRGDENSKKLARAYLREHYHTIPKLFGPLAERFRDRPGGYTRVLRIGHRYGDHAPKALIEYIGPMDIKQRFEMRKIKGESMVDQSSLKV
ncbi:mitochondrial 54S ribosomal protein bL17m [Calcarisporiella thermophila]|uniref:mitochondrial 54S ribosomal protein bL17m n=1 Tax=Calcarisporiella thermophila TaxID=911321 RepID=UPI00374261B0